MKIKKENQGNERENEKRFNIPEGKDDILPIEIEL